MRGTVTLVSGLPGVGKTSVSRALAAGFDRGVHLDTDVIGEQFIITGLVLPGEEPHDDAERQLSLRRANLIALATNFAEAGFDVVISDVVLWQQLLDTYVDGLGRDLRFILLTASPAAISARDAARDKQVADSWAHLRADQDSWNSPGVRIDTTDETLEETVTTIRGHWSDARVHLRRD
ncbi:AAA family ATPase [Microbacterium sp.]|uniref:AAA family ATPase n=1 Tax=Microbacterium sp. TaxID=51671 RepID=UPI0028111B06|nr:AAA family ATPase [Microbacterium sp.]